LTLKGLQGYAPSPLPAGREGQGWVDFKGWVDSAPLHHHKRMIHIPEMIVDQDVLKFSGNNRV